MAKANWRLIQVLRITADRLTESSDYHWAHVGKCNCGHLAQTITGLSAKAIFHHAHQSNLSEWTEYANDYCPFDNTPMDSVIAAILEVGLVRSDIHRLEYLSDAHVLSALPGGMRYLRRSEPKDVALYLKTWASLLEQELLQVPNYDLIPFPGPKAMGE